VLTTWHQKSITLAPPFEKILGAGMLEYVFDTAAILHPNSEMKSFY
jgi:hypothetical protein